MIENIGTIYDCTEEREILIGSRVEMEWLAEENLLPPYSETTAKLILENTGTVIRVTDHDGDYSDELERGVHIPPTVIVKFDDGSEGRLNTQFWDIPYMADPDEGKGYCEDLRVIGKEN
jgi:hypothetical protein